MRPSFLAARKDESCCHEVPGVGRAGVAVGVGGGVGWDEAVEPAPGLELPAAVVSVGESLLDETSCWVALSEPGARDAAPDAAIEPARPSVS
jgi:hypothetical protein